MFKTYEPIEYLCIDIANCFGNDDAVGFKGDKSLFEERIQWVKDNFNVLEDRAEEAEDKPLYIKAVMALRETMAGKKTGHLVSLDATCSGIQLMSAITGCKEGGSITGLILPNKRCDAYSEITKSINQILTQDGIANVVISRSDAKEAIMTAGYGSKATPEEIFGKDMVKYFYAGCHLRAPGAFTLMDILINAWQPYTLAHTWVLPDGFTAHIRVLETIEAKIEIDELDHHRFETKYTVNRGKRNAVSLAANVIHSIDSYLLRSVLRRTNYNVKQIKLANKLLKEEKKAIRRTPINTRIKFNMVEFENRFNTFQMVDALTLDYISKGTVGYLSMHHIDKLIALSDKMLEHKPFETLTVHDAFRTHPNNCNAVRYWYKEIVAELAESQILNTVLHYIIGYNPNYAKLSGDMAKYIRNSNYAIC